MGGGVKPMDYMSLNEALTNTVILNEFTTKSGLTYIGKTKNLLKAEKIIHDHLININTNKNDEQKIPKFVKSHLKDLEQCFKDEFGFKLFHLNIFTPYYFNMNKAVPISMITRNAFTFPPNFIMRDISNKTPTPLFKKDKFYDYGHTHLCSITITYDWFYGDFTAGEIMATILHEIGHNFDVALSTYIATVINTVDIVQLFRSGKANIFELVTTLFPNWTSGSLFRFIANWYNQSGAGIILDTFSRFYNLLEDLSSIAVIGRLKDIVTVFQAVRPKTVVANNLMFNAERFADSFATMYGYGPESVSMQDKFERRRALQGNLSTVVNRLSFSKKGKAETEKDFKSIDKSHIWTFMKNWTYCGTALLNTMTMLLDPHPETQTRCKMILEDCKKLSESKDFPPEIRALMKKDYEAAKKRYDTYMGLDKDDQQSFAAKMIKAFKEKVFGGKMDLRTYIFRCTAIQSGALNPTTNKKK